MSFRLFKNLFIQVSLAALMAPTTALAQSACEDLFSTFDITTVHPRFKKTFDYSPYYYEKTPARGIEFEANMPEGTTRYEVMKSLFSKLLDEHSVYREQYNNARTLTAKRKIYYDWKIYVKTPEHPEISLYSQSEIYQLVMRDSFRLTSERNKVKEIWQVVPDHTASTIYGNDVEITSPILRTTEDLQRFTKILTDVSTEMNLTTSDRTGIHVHVDFPKPRNQEVGVLYWLMSRIEKQIKNRLNVKETDPRAQYIRPLPIPDEVISDKLLKMKFPDYMKEMEEIGFYNIRGVYQQAKYHTFNVLSLSHYGTVEFRVFPSVTDTVRIENYANFSALLVKAVREKNPALLELISKHADDETIPLREVEKIIGIKLMAVKKTP